MANQTDAFKGSPIQEKNEKKIAFEKPGLIHKACMEFMEASFKIKFQIIVVIVYFLDQTKYVIIRVAKVVTVHDDLLTQ